MTQRPNILYLMADQLAPQVLKAYGGKVCRTPHIDRLIEMGVNFENAFATTPLCNPSRTAVLSGQTPFTTGVHHNNGRDIFSAVDPGATLPAFFGAHGYLTASKGKVFHDTGTDATAEILAGVFEPFRADRR